MLFSAALYQSFDMFCAMAFTIYARLTDGSLNNLYGAIEKGVIALDSMLQVRVNQLRDMREKVMTDMALLKRDKPSSRKLSLKQVEYACNRMKEMLLDAEAGYGKQIAQSAGGRDSGGAPAGKHSWKLCRSQ